MQVDVRSLELPEGADLIWQGFNCPVPYEGEGVILTYGEPRRVEVFEVVRVTHRLTAWNSPANGSHDSITVWVKAKDAVVGRWSKP